MSRCSLKFFVDTSILHVTCYNISPVLPLQLNGNRGVNGLSAQSRAAKGQEQGDVIAVSKPSMVLSSVQEIFLSLRTAYQLLVQVKFEPFFSHYHHKKYIYNVQKIRMYYCS